LHFMAIARHFNKLIYEKAGSTLLYFAASCTFN
jgi:hypothetical protein